MIKLREAKIKDLSTLLEFEKRLIEYERAFTPNLKKSDFNYYDLKSYIKNPEISVVVADKQKILSNEVKRQINFSSKKLEKFLSKKKIKNKIFKFKNILKFKNKEDLLTFYRSTVFYNKNKEKDLLKYFDLSFRKRKYLNVLKSARLYKFKL